MKWPKKFLKGASNMTTTITNLITDTWDNMLGRVAICAVCFGWLPFYLLTRVTEALQG